MNLQFQAKKIEVANNWDEGLISIYVQEIDNISFYNALLNSTCQNELFDRIVKNMDLDLLREKLNGI